MFDTTPFEDERVITAMELAKDYPQASVELLKQANYPNGFIVGGVLKKVADDNFQSFLDTLKAIGIELNVGIKE